MKLRLALVYFCNFNYFCFALCLEKLTLALFMQHSRFTKELLLKITEVWSDLIYTRKMYGILVGPLKCILLQSLLMHDNLIIRARFFWAEVTPIWRLNNDQNHFSVYFIGTYLAYKKCNYKSF